MTIAAPRLASAARLAAALALLAAPVAAQPAPAPPRAAPAVKPAPPATAAANVQAENRGGGKPIEIQADRLEVDQEQEFATFTGNVDAVQGELSLRADRLRVYYTEDGGQQATGPAGGGDSQGIRRIEAQGDVVLRQPGETAEGDAGVYDPSARTLVLEGNVVLTRGDNVVRGARLDSNLASGVSVVTAAPGADRSRRVRALFVPEQGEASQ